MTAGDLVAFDLETTGLNAAIDRVVEIGAVRFSESGVESGRFQSLVNPERPTSAGAFAVHGITDAELARAPTIDRVLPGFLDFLGDPQTTRLMAHHASFDAGFLGSELARCAVPIPGFGVIDTLALSRAVRPDLRTHRLDYLTRFYRLSSDAPHRALADGLRVKELWFRLEGAAFPADRLVTFPVFDPRRSLPIPRGWEPLIDAIANGDSIRMIYEGGSRGAAPRMITPKRILQKGGIVYVVALCHIQNFEKSFRLDRIQCYEVAAEDRRQARAQDSAEPTEPTEPRNLVKSVEDPGSCR